MYKSFLIIVFATFSYTQENITQDNIQDAVDLWELDSLQASSIYGHISDWDVSNVTNMENLFFEKSTFNSNIQNWDVSNVENMSLMFCRADSFNQDISSWDVSSVTNMYGMFAESTILMGISLSGT